MRKLSTHFLLLAKSERNRNHFQPLPDQLYVNIPALDDLFSVNDVRSAFTNLHESFIETNVSIPTSVMKLSANDCNAYKFRQKDAIILPHWWYSHLMDHQRFITGFWAKKTLAAENCRLIEVLPLPTRITFAVVAKRMEFCANLHDDQFGFRSGCCTTDQTFTLQVIIEYSTWKAEQCLLLNFWSAFNSDKPRNSMEILAKKKRLKYPATISLNCLRECQHAH